MALGLLGLHVIKMLLRLYWLQVQDHSDKAFDAQLQQWDWSLRQYTLSPAENNVVQWGIREHQASHKNAKQHLQSEVTFQRDLTTLRHEVIGGNICRQMSKQERWYH